MREIPPYNGHRRPNRPSRREMVRTAAKLAGPRRPFAACVHSLDTDLNVQVILRTLACFNGAEFFVIGSNRWFTGASAGIEEFIKITHFKTPIEFLKFIRTTDYSLVPVELSERSISVHDAVYPENPCFVMGNETYGLSDDILCKSDLIVQIPMDGVHPCLNVAVAASIVIYDYVNKRV